MTLDGAQRASCCDWTAAGNKQHRDALSDLMVRFSMTSGKFSSSAFSSSKVMAPLLSLSADSNSASVRSSSFSSGREMALSRRHDFRTVRSSSGSMEPLPARMQGFCQTKRGGRH